MDHIDEIDEKVGIRGIRGIKNVLYINLDSRVDRKNNVENELRKIGLIGEKFSAIINEKGHIGCTMSHIRCLEIAKERDLDHILIVEDDILFKNPDIFIDQLNKFLRSNKDFDVLLLAGNNYKPYLYVDEFCIQVNNCQTTTGYLVKNHYYDKLIDNYKVGLKNLIESSKDIYCIDQYWKNLQKNDKWFLITPLTVTQREGYSNIEKKKVNYDWLMLDLDKNNTLNIRNNITNRNMIYTGFGRKFL